MKFIQNLSIRNKLLLVSIIPLAALLYFLATDVSDKISKQKSIKGVYNDVIEIEKISDIIYSIQEERGFSISYVASGGKVEKSELFNQRLTTDKMIAALNQLAARKKNNQEMPMLAALPDIRNDVNRLTSNLDSMGKAYALITSRLIDDVNATYRSAHDDEIRNQIESHLLLLKGEGYLGQLRMRLHIAILQHGFLNNEFADFASLKGKYEMNLDRYLKNATPQQAAEFRLQLNNPAVQTAKMLIDSVYNNSTIAARIPIDTWRMNISTFLSGLKELEDKSTYETRQLAEEKMAAVSGALLRGVLIVFFVIVLIILLLIFVIRSIVNSLLVIKNAADLIVMGETDIILPIISKDEIGNLAASFNRLVEVSREYTIIAETIARGDYTPVIKVRSEADLLSKALKNMKKNLQKLSQENEVRTWMLTGAAELNNILRGDKTIEAELRAQQEELQQTNEELEEKANLLEEQKEKLELAKMEVENKARELESTSKYKSEFLANMSHELRTPLNSILILSQLLTENKSKALSPKDIEFATNIFNSGNDLLTLINEILDLSKVEAGKIEIEINEVPVSELINNLKQLFTEVAKSKHIGFDIHCDEKRFPLPLQTDKQRLEQILRNLLSNAFVYRPGWEN